jgi:hypothetical protein
LLSIHATLLVDHASSTLTATARCLTDSATLFLANTSKHLAKADHFLLAFCCPTTMLHIRRRGYSISTPESAPAGVGASLEPPATTSPPKISQE